MQLKIHCAEGFDQYQEQSKRFWMKWSDEKDISKYNNYIADIETNLELSVNSMNFKRLEAYRTVVLLFEKKDVQDIKANYYHMFKKCDVKRLKNLCRVADSIGKPLKILTFLGQTDPANIKYIFHALSILEYLKRLKRDNVNIIEIGGGYGGLAFFLSSLARDMGVNINSYTIFDLKPACSLQKIVLDNLEIDITTKHVDDQLSLHENSFLISNYGYSELNEKHKKDYIAKVFPYISNGFLTWNVTPIDIKYFRNLNTDTIEITEVEKIRCQDLRVIF